jgi:hypothetical protein
MKYALLPLLREKHQILIRTVGADYHFTSVVVGKKGEEFSLVHMLQTPNNNKKGTCIAISGVDPNDFKYRFVPFLEQDLPDSILLTAAQGCIARHALAVEVQKSGALYIRDIFVSKINSYYSYNFWFEDTTDILDPDRNHLKVDDDDKYLVGEEFFTLLEKINTPKGRKFWTNLLGLMYADTQGTQRNPEKLQRKPRRRARTKKRRGRKAKNTFEWKFLDNYDYEELGHTESKILFEVISEVVGTKEFSWSTDYREGKTLEHFGVVDLRDKLPNLYRQISDFVKSPDQLKEMDELEDKIVVLPPSAFKALGKPLVRKIIKLHEQLTESCHDMLNTGDVFDDDEDLHERNVSNLFFYTGSYSEGAEGVAGFYSSAENAIYIHAKYFKDPKFFVQVFIHELAHAHCYGCDDITEEFENALEEMAFAYQHMPSYWTNSSHKIWDTLVSIKYDIEDQEKFDWILSQSSEGPQHEAAKKLEYIEGEAQKEIDWDKRRKSRAKRAKKTKERNIMKLLRRADMLFKRGMDPTLPNTEEARRIVSEAEKRFQKGLGFGGNKRLRRPRVRRGQNRRALIQEFQDNRYINEFDRSRAIAKLRRGTQHDFEFLEDNQAWSDYLWQKRRNLRRFRY